LKRLFPIFILCGLLASANAQQVYFNNRYDYNESAEVIWSVLESESGYICAVGTGKILLLSLDTLGNKVWEKPFGKPNETYFAGTSGSLVPTFDGGYALGGSVDDSTGNNQALLVKFDATGDTVWTKRYGGAGFDTFRQCKQTPDSGFILIGATSSGGGDILLIKTDSLGNLQWQRTYGGSGNESGLTVDLTIDNEYILGGYTNSFGAGGFDTYVINVNDTGGFKWSKTYGSTEDDNAANIIQTSDSNYIISTARYHSNIFSTNDRKQIEVIKIDTSGTVIWDKTYGPARFAAGPNDIYELSDGSFIISGQINDASSVLGQPEGMLLKISAQGDSLWWRTYELFPGPSSQNYLRNVQPTLDGGFIAAGFALPVSPDTGTQDMWVLKLDSCGCAYVGCDSACQELVGIEETTTPASLTLKIYPNPASGMATVRIPNEEQGIKNYQLSIYNITGKQVKRYAMQNQPTLTINTKELGSGLYFLRLKQEGRMLGSGKLVVE